MPTDVYSSPAVRAYDTGYHALAAAEIALPIATAKELQELDRGEWTGRQRKDIEADQALQSAMKQQGMAFAPHNGESMDDVFARMVGWANGRCDTSRQSDEPQRILAFSHSNAIGCFVAAAAGIERHYTDSIPIGYASLSAFAHSEEGWSTIAANIDTQTEPMAFNLDDLVA